MPHKSLYPKPLRSLRVFENLNTQSRRKSKCPNLERSTNFEFGTLMPDASPALGLVHAFGDFGFGHSSDIEFWNLGFTGQPILVVASPRYAAQPRCSTRYFEFILKLFTKNAH